MTSRNLPLHRLVRYDPDTGLFHRLRSGKPALNNKHIRGYLFGSVGGRRYLAHRAAWLLTYNEEPPMIDHINRVKTDNRIANLRAATASENMLNRVFAGGSSRYRGVWYFAAKNRWVARCAGE